MKNDQNQKSPKRWIACLLTLALIATGISWVPQKAQAASYHALSTEKWQWPMSDWYIISAGFGCIDPKDKKKHCGVDIARHTGNKDSVITAAQTGTVLRIINMCKKTEDKKYIGENGECTEIGCKAEGPHKGRGNYVVILTTCENGDRYVSIYMHMQPNSIPDYLWEGCTVSKGTKIGDAGNSGTSDGVHLHFEVHKFPAGTALPDSALLDKVDEKKDQTTGYKKYAIDPLDMVDLSTKKGKKPKVINGNACCNAYLSKHLNPDTTPPQISNVRVTDLTSQGYTVYCDVTDNVGVARVNFPTWTEANGQDDITWLDGVWVGGITYRYQVNISDHKWEQGEYVTHIYAYDAAGNSSNYRQTIFVPIPDAEPPQITNVRVTDVTSQGYTVYCDVTDNVGVTRVTFPTWTEANGQDDIAWLDGVWVGGITYQFQVNISAHNGEYGNYITHIYAYDAAGNYGNTGTTVFVPLPDTEPPQITNVRVTDLTSQGYRVYFEVTDNIGVARILWLAWSEPNGQDDAGAWLDATYVDGSTFSFQVNIADHNNERGNYINHIYAYDCKTAN